MKLSYGLFYAAVFFGNIENALLADQILQSNFNEKEYESVERVFATNTGHIDQLAHFVESRLLTQIQNAESLLDIGAGPATTTSKLSKFFKSTSVIEPNTAFASIYEKAGFNYCLANFQDAVVDKKFDMILCSHVLYHVPQAQWAGFIKKMHETLQFGGKGLILMSAPKGSWHRLRTSINPLYSNSFQVEQILKEQQMDYDATPMQSVFRVDNYEDFRALMRLFTIDDCFQPAEYRALSLEEREEIDQKIEDYIQTCKKPDGTYEFVEEEAYIVIHKPAAL